MPANIKAKYQSAPPFLDSQGCEGTNKNHNPTTVCDLRIAKFILLNLQDFTVWFRAYRRKEDETVL
jgi:hypothetical protein